MLTELELPRPAAEWLETSERLRAKIAAKIQQNAGRIGFDTYMHMALYEPALGYYLGGATKFGSGGDFVTAPDLTPLFGYAIADQCADILEKVANGTIVEFGGGTGRLAASLLTRLRELECDFGAYLIIELSPELRDRQQQLLRARVPELFEKVRWLNTVPSSPVNGVIIANEILDSVPLKTYSIDDDAVYERQVSVDDRGKFEWVCSPPPERVRRAVEALRQQGYFPTTSRFDFEICGALDSWVHSLSSILANGAALLFDYGHGRRELYSEAHAEGTLRCYFQHRVHNDPFVYPGLQDITASVDFTRVAEAASDAALSVTGYTDQAQFLMGCGILDQLSHLQSTISADEAVSLNEQVKTLLLPSKMGTRFKVLGLTRNLQLPLRGFSLRDGRYLL